MSKINNILVMRLSSMGDVAMVVPVIRALVEQNSALKITVISRSFFRPFFEDIPNIHFFAVDLKKRHKGLLGLLRLFSDLNRMKVDAFADLHNVLRSKIVKNLFAVKGIPVATVNKGRAQKKALTRRKNKIFQPLPTIFERYTQVFRNLGLTITLENPVFPSVKALDPIILDIVGVKEQKWIGIAPFAQYLSKVYPMDLMEKVIHILTENKAYKIFLFGGGEKEITLLNQLAGNRDNVIVIAAKMTFEQELQLISNLDIMLSMDSGNAHIAAMLGIKVITLWGATHPFTGFSPFNQPLENTLTADRQKYPMLPTSVYGNIEIQGYQDAMRSILPEQVVLTIQSRL